MSRAGYLRTYRKRRRARGLCIYCPRPATAGSPKCEECREKHRKWCRDNREVHTLKARVRRGDRAKKRKAAARAALQAMCAGCRALYLERDL
jgi:hypothetical protein